ncbi:hypothetical protein TX23_19490 [Pseudomonas paralactis]|uniref:Uncharacterized protein n=1 Tax=Pseudomonas paralactis TaxID=1615673 RepID=A0A0R3AC88_9PSED|nr:hypothetical protein TX23_19490 [Pseudomonas paralactis]
MQGGGLTEAAWSNVGGLMVGQPVHIYLMLRDGNVGGAVRRFDLPPMAALGPARMLDQTGYISVIWITAAMGSALTAGHFRKARK